MQVDDNKKILLNIDKSKICFFKWIRNFKKYKKICRLLGTPDRN